MTLTVDLVEAIPSRSACPPASRARGRRKRIPWSKGRPPPRPINRRNFPTESRRWSRRSSRNRRANRGQDAEDGGSVERAKGGWSWPFFAPLPPHHRHGGTTPRRRRPNGCCMRFRRGRATPGQHQRPLRLRLAGQTSAPEQTLKEELTKARPGYGFLMEESGVSGSENWSWRWVVDPLDGTTNFLHGIPHWAISIGLERRLPDGTSELAAGLIYAPAVDEMFWAEKGAGAFVNERRMRVSARREMTEAVFATGIPFRAVSAARRNSFSRTMISLMPQVAGIRRFGAAALDLAWVAAGRYDGYWELGIQPWDMAAGLLLVREAAAGSHQHRRRGPARQRQRGGRQSPSAREIAGSRRRRDDSRRVTGRWPAASDQRGNLGQNPIGYALIGPRVTPGAPPGESAEQARHFAYWLAHASPGGPCISCWFARTLFGPRPGIGGHARAGVEGGGRRRAGCSTEARRLRWRARFIRFFRQRVADQGARGSGGRQ